MIQPRSMVSEHIVEYIHTRWPQVSKREVRRIVREEFKRQRASAYIRTEEQIVFDTLVRVTQIYEMICVCLPPKMDSRVETFIEQGVTTHSWENSTEDSASAPAGGGGSHSRTQSSFLPSKVLIVEDQQDQRVCTPNERERSAV